MIALRDQGKYQIVSKIDLDQTDKKTWDHKNISKGSGSKEIRQGFSI